jgi:hypothetical protein
MTNDTQEVDRAGDWFNMNLSELVEKSLALKVIPMIHFLDKGKVVSDSKPIKSKPFLEETPVYILQKEIRSYRNFIKRVKSMDNVPNEKKKDIAARVRIKIKEFQSAIQQLKKKK